VFDDTEQDVDALGRGQAGVEVVVGAIRIRETIEQLHNPFHLFNLPRMPRPASGCASRGTTAVGIPTARDAQPRTIIWRR